VNSNIDIKLSLNRAIWFANKRRSIVNKGFNVLAEFLENKIKSVIDDSTPAGRLYRIGSVTGKSSASNRGSRKVRGAKTRVIISGKFHRASAPGQPPAKLTLTLYRSIKVKRVVGRFAIIASVRAPGVEVLDDPARLSRLFFRTTIEAFYSNDFNDQARQIVTELLTTEN
jgi:hypothetical protein